MDTIATFNLRIGLPPMHSLRYTSPCRMGVASMKTFAQCSVLLACLILPLGTARAQMPEAIATAGEMLVATIHAEGAQVYECKADAAGKLAWQFREPIATLIADGKTVGRHYAGPNWELADGSAVVAKVAGRAPGASAKDIPLLKLEVTSQRGSGQLSGVTTVQRLNTKGGIVEGSCEAAGVFLNVPYSADYAFLKKKG
jgi:Protein of unknown function (DUF3455)